MSFCLLVSVFRKSPSPAAEITLMTSLWPHQGYVLRLVSSGWMLLPMNQHEISGDTAGKHSAVLYGELCSAWPWCLAIGMLCTMAPSLVVPKCRNVNNARKTCHLVTVFWILLCLSLFLSGHKINISLFANANQAAPCIQMFSLSEVGWFALCYLNFWNNCWELIIIIYLLFLLNQF